MKIQLGAFCLVSILCLISCGGGEADIVSDTNSSTTNSTPVANAGIDQNVLTGSTVGLNGSGSDDSDNNTLIYSWTIQSTPSGSSAVLSDNTAVKPTLIVDYDGAYVFQLVVNDGKVDSAADTVTVTAVTARLAITIGKFGANISGTYAKWWGGVRGPDDKIYGIPHGVGEILVIDPASNAATLSTMGVSLADSNKWASGCLGPDGKIYAAPYNAPDVLIIDPVAGTAVRNDFGLNLDGTAKWAGAVLGADNKIYCIPRRATDILIIDPATNTATRSAMGVSFTVEEEWSGGILGANGKIYGVPRNSVRILIIDTASGTASLSNMGAPLSPNHQYAEGILAPNGKIYAIPYSAPEVLIIDPATETASLDNMGEVFAVTGWSEAVLGPDGKIYTVPYTASDLLTIDPATDTAARTSIDGVEPSSVHRWVMGDIVNNSFYGIPYGSEDIILVELF